MLGPEYMPGVNLTKIFTRLYVIYNDIVAIVLESEHKSYTCKLHWSQSLEMPLWHLFVL